MLTAVITRIVDFSARHAWTVLGLFALLVALSGEYVVRNIAINTDVARLLDADPAWSRRDAAIAAAFPGRSDSTVVVVRAPAAEFATEAARELAARLRQQPARFREVNAAAASDFFARNGLLYLPAPQVATLTAQLVQARPLVDALARDPSLRGLANLLSVSLFAPLHSGQLRLPDMAPLFERSASAVEAALARKPAALSWQALAEGGSAAPVGQSLVEVLPVLDFGELEPGAPSARAIRAAAADLRLLDRYGAQVALTGAVPLADDEFASVQEGALVSNAVTLCCVLLLLWLALRSKRLVVAVFITLMGGLVITAALGLLMVGALNIISVAFAILFVGLGVDFALQFGMRFRGRRRILPDAASALHAVAQSIAAPLTLAAVATAVGFFTFLPTAYRGVAELGLIAGVGILMVAFPSCLTVLPALTRLFDPLPVETAPGYPWLGPVERVVQHHRKRLLAAILALVFAGLPLLWHLRFDFNPLHLKDPGSESMATLRSLAGSDEIGIDNIQVLSPSLAEAQALGARLAALPEVAGVMTLASLVPDRQPEKLAAIGGASAVLLPLLEQEPAAPATDAQRVAALRAAAQALRNAALDYPGPGAAPATRLAGALGELARADASARDRAENALAGPLRLALASLRQSLQPTPVTLASLPPELARNWVAPNGLALLDVAPKRAPGADPGDDSWLRDFAQAVQRLAPDATGGPVSVLHSAELVIRAFIQAAVLAVAAITVLLRLALRSNHDVLLTIVPLLVSGLVTLELCVLFGISLNFANIIALPLLLGVGVAFKIYYVMAWRAGQTGLLQHGLTQAVLLSAATTATAFGSLWLSHHPGTASMGELLVLSLFCTLVGAVFFQPILMGKPRRVRPEPSHRARPPPAASDDPTQHWNPP
jgi:hopanoid biosynthesis associated RND transporter like protein HpnN